MKEAQVKDGLTRILMQNGGAHNLPDALQQLMDFMRQCGVTIEPDMPEQPAGQPQQ